MNNWLALTPEQVIEIQSQVPSFDEEEVKFNGSLRAYDVSYDIEKIYEIYIEWLEIKILDKYFTLIDDETELKRAVIRLTNEQYEHVKDTLLNNSYD